MTTALEADELPTLTCAGTYPAALRQDRPLTLAPDAVSAPEAAPEPAAPERGSQRRRLLAVASRLRAPDGDTVITWAMTGAAAAVILFAAIVSYSHIHGLATGHREDSVQAHLLPLSIDGVIAEASLVLLFAARHKLDAPRLARVMLWTGIVATLAANAVVALPPSWLSPVANVVIGAVLSAWPAAAFIASVELIMLLVRDVRAVAAGEILADTEGDTDGDTETDTDGDSGGDKPEPPPSDRRRQRKPTARDTVSATIDRHPLWDNDKVAAHCGVSVRTVERRRAAKAAKATAPA
jgi:hypothetical protein